jgi:hypothetical protein
MTNYTVTWELAGEPGSVTFDEADPMLCIESATALVPEGADLIAVFETPVPEPSEFTTPDGQKWTLGLTSTGNPKWVKVTA